MNTVLSFKDLSVRIKDRTLFQDVTFDVCEGDVVLLSGENGTGKSTLLKAILQLESEGKEITGKIIDKSFGDVLSLSSTDIQKYRARVAYVQQKDEYSEMGNIMVRDIISENGEPHTGKTLSVSDVNEIIDRWIPRRSDGKRVFDAKSKPGKFSGGEQRLLYVLSAIAARPHADLIIIDEPLNNLDFINARIISDLINRVIHDNPKAAVLMISHCRIFPFITREIRLTPTGAAEVQTPYSCHSCFGEPNSEGFYL